VESQRLELVAVGNDIAYARAFGDANRWLEVFSVLDSLPPRCFGRAGETLEDQRDQR
jgi:hypothetical protein